MSEVRITVTRNGSYHVTGPVKMFDHTGNEIDITDDEIWLCRCGASNSKPFCDASHRGVKFQGAIAESVTFKCHAAAEGDPLP